MVSAFTLVEMEHNRRICFQITWMTMLDGKWVKGSLSSPVPVREAFDWLETMLRSALEHGTRVMPARVRVELEGKLGKDVAQTFRGASASSIVVTCWKGWYTQAVQAQAALFQQKVVMDRKSLAI
jgi:hypothetical protein